MSQRRKLLVPALLLAAVLLWGLTQQAPQERIVKKFAADFAGLENCAWLALEQGAGASVQPPEGWRSVTVYRGDAEGMTVDFFHSGSGFGSSSVYRGVVYVPDDIPLGFQGQRTEYWKKQGEGRLYYEPESDNTCYVERLKPCWYYYEARF